MSNTTLHEPLDGSLCRSAATGAPTGLHTFVASCPASAARPLLAVVTLAMGLLVMLAACGQKGALYIPAADNKPLRPAATHAASAPSASPAAPIPASSAPSRPAP